MIAFSKIYKSLERYGIAELSMGGLCQAGIVTEKDRLSLHQKKVEIGGYIDYLHSAAENLENILNILEAHDIRLQDCDRSGKDSCDCLDRAVKSARISLEKLNKIKE